MKAVLPAICLAVLAWPASIPLWAGEASGSPPGATPTPAMVVGVVRADGMLVPLAARASRSEGWTSLSVYEVAAGGQMHGTHRIRDPDVLPGLQWTLHRRGGAASQAIAVHGVETVRAHCERQEVLATNVVARGSGEATSLPALGIATHGSVTVLPAEDVTGGSDAASRLAAQFIEQLVQAVEADRAGQPASRVAATAEQRARTPVQITKLSQVRDPYGDFAFYFEAEKAYGRTSVHARGWMHSTGSRLRLTGVSAGVDQGGESTRQRSEVVGALQVGPETFWVMETAGYEGRSHELVGMQGTLITASGGGC